MSVVMVKKGEYLIRQYSLTKLDNPFGDEGSPTSAVAPSWGIPIVGASRPSCWASSWIISSIWEEVVAVGPMAFHSSFDDDQHSCSYVY